MQHGKLNVLLYWESFDVRRLLQITVQCLFPISRFSTKRDVFVVHVGLFQQRFKELLCTGQNTSLRMQLEWLSKMGWWPCLKSLLKIVRCYFLKRRNSLHWKHRGEGCGWWRVRQKDSCLWTWVWKTGILITRRSMYCLIIHKTFFLSRVSFKGGKSEGLVTIWSSPTFHTLINSVPLSVCFMPLL